MAFPYQDPALSAETRANDLLGRMNLEEKIAQMHALWLILSEDGRHRPRQDDFTGGSDPAAVQKALRHGLATVAYHDSDVKQLMGELSQFYRRLLDGQKVETRTAKDVIEHNVAAPPARSADGETTEAVDVLATAPQSPVEEIVLSSEPAEESEAPPDGDDEVVRSVRELKVGTWLEFIEENGQRERAKLSWISRSQPSARL